MEILFAVLVLITMLLMNWKMYLLLARKLTALLGKAAVVRVSC